MNDGHHVTAIARWVIHNDVVLFYGSGGVFQGEAFTRWLAELQAANDLRLCVCGAGAVFAFDAGVRAGSIEYFKRRNLPFAVITDNAMHRVLGSTARMSGMDLQIYSWSESQRPFLKLGVSQETADQLLAKLLRLRKDVEAELQNPARS